MKKLIILTIISAFWLSATAQQTELTGGMGVFFGSNREAAKLMMKAKHPDARLDDEGSNKNFLFYAGGTWIGKKVAIWAFVYDQKDELNTIIVQTTPDSESEVFDHFDSVVKDLTTKYGEPTGVIANWKYPYEEKDKSDHGVVALKSSKCKMMTYWQWTNPASTDGALNTILVEIMPDLDTKVTYQDGVRIKEVNKQRTEEKQSEM